jgi:hypothetical protein
MSDFLQGKSAQMTHAELLRMRDAHPEPFMQEVLAPMEHKAFAREYVQENPLMAPAMLTAPALYYLAKKMKLMGGRTPPSIDQVFAGMEGTIQGLRSRISKP